MVLAGEFCDTIVLPDLSSQTLEQFIQYLTTTSYSCEYLNSEITSQLRFLGVSENNNYNAFEAKKTEFPEDDLDFINDDDAVDEYGLEEAIDEDDDEDSLVYPEVEFEMEDVHHPGTSSSTRYYPKKSKVWSYFEDPDSEGKCECKLCCKIIASAGGTSNLRGHLKIHHKEHFEEISEGKASLHLGKKGKSPVWRYFERTEDNDTNQCLLCNNLIKCHNNTTNMKHHLRSKHKEEFARLDQVDDSEPISRRKRFLSTSPNNAATTSTSSGTRKKRSVVWSYFTLNEGDDTADCHECGRTVCGKGKNTTNYFKHLSHNHPELYILAQEQSGQDVEQNKKLREVLQNYFSWNVENESCRCNECGQVVKGKNHTQRYVDHLRNHHWDYYGEVMEKSGILSEQMNQMRNSAWKHFDDNRCKHCLLLIAPDGFSNHVDHLKEHHEELHEELMDEAGLGEPKKKKRKSDEKPEESRTCPQCHKLFSVRSAMLFHIRVVHSGERPYKCQECDETFARLDAFKAHIHNLKVR